MRWLWMMCTVSPPLWLAIAGWFIDGRVDAGDERGLWPMGKSAYLLLMFVGGFYAIVLQLVVVQIRLHYRKLFPKAESLAQFANLLKRRTLWVAVVAEAVTVFGFALAVVQGEMFPMLVFGLAGLALYAQACPRDGEFISQ